MKQDWNKLRKIKGGHSYWRRISDGEVGIADASGTYPENCEPADSPPLLLDRSRPVAMDGRFCMVPVKHENGRASWTPVLGFEALWVVVTFNMKLSAQEKDGDAELVVFVTEAVTT